MAQKITFPPSSTVMGSHGNPTCLTYGEQVEIEFDHPGYFSNDNANAFTPHLPIGNQPANPAHPIGPFTAASTDQTVTLSFRDSVDGKPYSDRIRIRKEC